MVGILIFQCTPPPATSGIYKNLMEGIIFPRHYRASARSGRYNKTTTAPGVGIFIFPHPPPPARSGIYENLIKGIIIPQHLVVCWCGLLIREDRFDALHYNLGRSCLPPYLV
jgi:hypothetical protein